MTSLTSEDSLKTKFYSFTILADLALILSYWLESILRNSTRKKKRQLFRLRIRTFELRHHLCDIKFCRLCTHLNKKYFYLVEQ